MAEKKYQTFFFSNRTLEGISVMGSRQTLQKNRDPGKFQGSHDKNNWTAKSEIGQPGDINY